MIGPLLLARLGRALRAVPWQAWAFLAATAAIWLAIDHYAEGRVARALIAVQQQNQEARHAAEKARNDLARECARDAAGCLRDEWTRDR